ncbi:unnamed protein product [Gadus morhua 'NCC']
MVNVNTQVPLRVRLPFGEYTARFGCCNRFGRREISHPPRGPGEPHTEPCSRQPESPLCLPEPPRCSPVHACFPGWAQGPVETAPALTGMYGEHDGALNVQVWRISVYRLAGDEAGLGGNQADKAAVSDAAD